MEEATQKLSYLAGIFDGEGCVLIVGRNPRCGRSLQYNVACCVNMQDGAPIKLFRSLFGGSYYIRKKGGNFPAAEWRVTNKKAKTFIEAIIDYTIVKHPQLELALEFMDKCKNIKRTGLYGAQKKLSESELSVQANYKEMLSKLKKVHSV